jgi:hypothetical protein
MLSLLLKMKSIEDFCLSSFSCPGNSTLSPDFTNGFFDNRFEDAPKGKSICYGFLEIRLKESLFYDDTASMFWAV